MPAMKNYWKRYRWRGLMSAINEFYSVILKTPEDTQKFAASLAKLCKIGDCILLYGDVGVGKTTFARGFIQAISTVQEEIISPTFTLVQTYPLIGGGEAWHYDLYRLKNQTELLELGLDDALGTSIILLEWPELAKNMLPQSALNVTLSIEGQGRRVNISGEAETWNDRLRQL